MTKRASAARRPRAHRPPASGAAPRGASDGADPLALARRLRQQLRARAHLYGAWMSIGHPEIAAIFARATGDFLGIDLEHTTIELSTSQAIIRACHEAGRACLPRMFPDNLEQMRRLLDAGADGVIVPQIATAGQIDRVVEALRYPPQGKRGFGVAGAQYYGRAFDAYVRGANAALSLIVQVETIDAVERIEEIVRHPAVDGLMVGPYDLSGSLGIPGDLTNPRVREACGRVVRACADASMSCGLHLVYPTVEEIRRELAAGFSFLVLGSDIFNLWRRSVDVDQMIAAAQRPEP